MGTIALRYAPPGPVAARFSVWGGGAGTEAFVRALMGPIGSGKTTACIFEIIGRGIRQKPDRTGRRRTRWAVIRNTYPELKTTTIKSWHQWVPETVGRWQSEGPPTHVIEMTLGAGDVVEIEVIFLALDRPEDVRKLLSLELTGAWINEAREVPRAVLDNLTGRVGRFPAMADGGPTWSGIIMDTNPPDQDGWLYRLFEEEKPEGFELFRQPGGRSPGAENRQNLLPTYYERTAQGKKPEWIRVYIDAEYGIVMDGKPVFPDYRDLTHCRPTLLIPGLPVSIGIDFGLTPAATFGQRTARGQCRVFREITSEGMGIKRFAELLLLPVLRGELAGYSLTIAGDPAGDARAQTDERTAFDILRACGVPARPAPTNDPSLRREPIEAALTRMVDGDPGYVIDPSCRMLRKGLAGGYRYRRVQGSGDRYEDRPEKNEFSHVADAEQYRMVGSGEARILVQGAQTGRRLSYVGHMAR